MIRSTKFFLLHVIFNTLLMFSVSVYLFTSSSDLDTSSDDALVIPQLLGVVPGKIYIAMVAIMLGARLLVFPM